jgi:hypothetical protein
MEFFHLLAGISSDADLRQAGFQAQRLYLLLNIVVPILLGILLVGPVKWLEKLLAPSRGGRV